MQQKLSRNVAVLMAVGVMSLGLAACSETEAPDCGALQVNDPWVRVAPQGARVMGAYFSLANDGDTRVVVNGVSSSQFDRAEMHETVVNDDGQASMQPLERVTVPAGETVDFKPGGRHVMLFTPSQAYAAGDQVELILSCGAQSAELPVAATVRAQEPGMQSQDDASMKDMKGMDHGEDGSSDAASDEAGAAAAEDAATAN